MIKIMVPVVIVVFALAFFFSYNSVRVLSPSQNSVTIQQDTGVSDGSYISTK